MVSFKNSLLDRIVSIFLVIAIVFTSLPISTVQVIAAEDGGTSPEEMITVTGTVKDAEGNGLGGVSVSAVSEPEVEGEDAETVGTVETVENGTFTLQLKNGSSYKITFTKDGYVNQEETIAVSAGLAALDITMPAVTQNPDEPEEPVTEVNLTGQVVVQVDGEENTTGLEGVTVTAVSKDDVNISYSGITDSDENNKGNYSISVDVNTIYNVTFEKEGYETQTLEDIEVVEADLAVQTVTLVKAESITYTGTVIDKTGAGMGGVTVSLSSETEGALDEGAITREDGSYTLTLTKDADYKLTFTLDGYGIEEVSLNSDMTANDVPNAEAVTLLPLDNTFKFTLQDAEITIPYGEVYTANPALSENQPEEVVTYEIINQPDVNDTIANVDSNGAVTPVKAGIVTVKATIAKNDTYAKTEISYALNITKADLSDFKFANESTDGPIEVGYQESTYTNIASSAILSGILGEDAAKSFITYKIKEENSDIAEIDGSTGVVIFKNAGTVTVVATLAESDCYNGDEIEYTLCIKGTPVEGFAFTNGALEHTFDPMNNTVTNELVRGNGSGTVSYSITAESDLDNLSLGENEHVVSLAEDGTVTVLRSGIVKIQAYMAEKGGFEAATAEYTLTVNKASQAEFTFTILAPEAITFNAVKTFENAASGGNGTGAVTYSVADEYQGYVKFEDPSRPVLTILKPCEEGITITAEKAADSCYKEAVATYVLIINKDSQVVAFKDLDQVKVIYGIENYRNEVEATEYENKYNVGISTGTISYGIESDVNGVVASIDETTGKITFVDGKTGTVAIWAEIAGDEYYKDWSGRYELEVAYAELPEGVDAYSLDGEKALEGNDWYIGPVSIIPADGYWLSSENLRNGDWQESFGCSGEGINNLKIYLKNKVTREITDVISVEEIKIDTVNPVVYDIEYAMNPVDTMLSALTLGLYDAETLYVTVSAWDDGSGLKSITYLAEPDGEVAGSTQIAETEVPITEETEGMHIDADNKIVKYTFEVSAEFRGNIKFWATDYAGRKSEEKIGEGIVVDNAAPEITIQLMDESGTELTGDAILTKDTVTAQISIAESNFVSDKTKVFLNNEEIAFDAVNWSREGDIWKNTVTVELNGNYELTINTEDLLGKTGTKTAVFEIDKTFATITESYENYGTVVGEEESGYTYYYKVDESSDTVIIPIQITEKNFETGNVTVLLKKDGTENSIDIDWTEEPSGSSIWKSAIELTEEGIYSFKVQITDKAGNTGFKNGEEADGEIYQSQMIVVDATAPTVSIDLLTETGLTPEGYIGSQTYADNYDETIIARVTVSDTNIAPDQTEISANGNWEYVSEWIKVNDKTYYRDIRFTEDNIYTIIAKSVDKAGLETENEVQKTFVVDKTSVNVADMTISCSTPVLEKVIEYITFGYYKSHVEATLEATDNMTGIDSFTWTYTKESGSSQKNVEVLTKTITTTDAEFSENGKTATAKFRLTATEAEQFRGSVSFIVTDKAGNKSASKNDGERINVVDNITPERTVTYSPAHKIVDKDTYEPIDNYQYDSEGRNVILCYDGNVKVTFTVTEMNFYPEETLIKVNGNIQDTSDWEQDGDVWTKSIALTGDGEYLVTMEYTDRSGNVMNPYASELLIIDTVDPKVEITLTDEDQTTLTEDNSLTNKTVTAQISIEDANFVKAETTVLLNDKIIVLDNESWSSDGEIWRNTVEVVPDGNYELTVNTKDLLGKGGTESVSFEIDKTPAAIEESYAAAVTKEEEAGRYYYSEDVTIPIEITEKNFDSTKVAVVVDGIPVEVLMWQPSDGNVYKTEIGISGEGEHIFTVTNTDKAENSGFKNEGEVFVTEYQSQTIIVDKTTPTVSIDLLTETDLTPEGYNGSQTYADNYDETIIARVTVSDTNIAPDQTEISANGNWEYVGEWIKVNDKTYYRDIRFTEDNAYTVTAKAVDKAGLLSINTAQKTFSVDKTPVSVENMTISYRTPVPEQILKVITFGYYQSNVEITLTATDNVTGIDSFTWTYTRESGSSEKNVAVRERTITTVDNGFSENGKDASAVFKLREDEAEQFRGSVSFTVTDKAGNKSASKNDGSYINIVDNITPKRTVTYSPAHVVVDKNTYEPIENYQYDSEGSNAILYYDGAITATFTVTEMNFYPEDTIIKVNGEKQDVAGWTQSGDVWTKSITLTGDGEYYVTMEYADRSGNVMNTYTSELLVIDTVTPTASIELLDRDGNQAEYPSNEKYFDQDIIAKVIVNDVNLVLKDAVLTINNQKVESPVWTNSQGEEWYTFVTLNTDNYYDVKITVDDYVDKAASAGQTLWVDKTKPGADKMSITYSGELNKWEQVLNAITFGYYAYAKEVEVTLTAWDNMSGIDYFTWSYTKENGTSDVNVSDRVNNRIDSSQITYSEGGKKAVAKFKLTASELEQFRGNISFTATDRADNSSTKNDNQRINIVDTITPTRKVTYTQAKQVLDASTMKTKEEYQYDAENTNSILYYDGNVTATFEITEANFYAEDVVVKVNGVARNVLDWTQKGDVWTGTMSLSGDGDYIVTMEYKDRSNNTMLQYTSERIVIDTIKPVIEVVYGNKNIQNNIENREYYNDVQTATITITEHNFRASDVVATVTAKDIEEREIIISNYAEYLSNKDNWKQNGDNYTATITYSIEGNYEFDIAYTDLAKHDADDYEVDYFTVDRTAPQNITISYSQSILDQILEAITFGFYNSNVTVTIQAEDAISGINEVRYSALRANGVSAVNTELIDALLSEAEIRKNGRTGTVEIKVPSGALGENSQFNGTVECKVSDRSKNVADSRGDRRLVVDNIAPTINVTISEPVQEANEIAYYDGDITVTMEVNEANFYAEDFILQVTRDGAEMSIVPDWADESADIHIGTFTLHEDGDYMITADYTDKSSNQMEQYQSVQLTIDTEEPVISISELQPNEASKEEVFGFTITADDTNFDVDTFKPLLVAVLQDENGNFYKKEIGLGTPQTVESGKTYAYVVENLEDDAIYTLTCEVTDMANHTKNVFTLEDGNEYENVQFSINRKGSNFKLETDTEQLVENYYIYDLEDDVVIEEINVNPVEIYAVRVNGELLTEGSQNGFETVLSGGGDEWSQRTYIIDKNLFEEEGTYNIIIESIDKTETVAYSDIRNAAVEFVVDKSAPLVTISGLESGGVYETDAQEVTVMPTDEGGRLNSFTALVLDSGGNPITDSVRIALEGEALLTHLAENDGKITFTVPEGLEQQVQIICTDCAVHYEDGSTNEYNQIFDRITVTQSELLVFYANKPLFYGTVAGVTAPVAGIAGFIFRRRRRLKIK